MPESTKAIEQKHLNVIVNKLKMAELKKLQMIKKTEKNERIIQKDFYNDVRLRSTTYSGLMETGVEVRQKQQMLSQLNHQWQQGKFFLKRLRLLEKQPYFARIDFLRPGSSRKHTIYIGLASFADEDGNYLIYDWRAPISSIYYQNKIGHVSYQTPKGRQDVKIILKRQFMIKAGKIQTVFDTNAAIGDELLLRDLGQRATPKMKNIVSTIQQDQNQVIRDTTHDLLYVQGAAGSGKTSAALQRVAFLMYHYRKHLTARQVILFSPNQLFNDYINHVLPSLGEHNMIRMTYEQYSNHRVPNFTVESLAQRFQDDNLTHRNVKIHHLKASLAAFKAMTKYIRTLKRSGMQFNNISFHHHLIASKEQIAQIFYSFNANYDLRNRLDATKTKLRQILNHEMKAQMKKKWVSDAIEDLDRRQLRAIQLTHPDTFQNIDNSYAFLAKHIVKGAFKGVSDIIKYDRFLNYNRQYLHWLKNADRYLNFQDYQVDDQVWQSGIKTFVQALDHGEISLADITPYLYLHDKITGSYGHREIKYIFIDEAQDYTSFQMAFLHYEFPHAKFTILADLNQAIFTHTASHDLGSALRQIFAKQPQRKVILTKSYRSTKPITDFSKSMLPAGKAIQSFARPGVKPKIQILASRGQEFAALQRIIDRDTQLHDSTAIITKSAQQSKLVHQQLMRRGVKHHWIRTENQDLATGVIVVPAYLAKGLEFDAVVMWDAAPENYQKDVDTQVAYTICTRAMHHLDVLSIHKLSPIFKVIPEKLYQQAK